MTARFDPSSLPIPAQRRLAIRLTPDALRQVRGGHPWVFDSSITSISHEGAPGDLAVIFDDRRRFVAIGFYDPTSPIRVNILHRGEPIAIDDDWWGRRLAEALERRRSLADGDGTDAYRLVHGENDGLGGVVVDRYASVVVVKIYSVAWFAHLLPLLAALDDTFGEPTVVLRFSRGVAAGPTFDLADGDVIRGELDDPVVEFTENHLRFEADVRQGQKTGHFLDQRENRARVRSIATGAEVLDVFACTGGFSVHAAAGGATEVTSVDLSEQALGGAVRNMAHNARDASVAACRHTTTKGDAFEVMHRLADRGHAYDIVVIDPPSFAHKRDDVVRATRAYARLTAAGLALVRSGGTLVQASCSARVTTDAFVDTVTRSAEAEGVRLHDLSVTTHGIDHPVSFVHGSYLKAVFARVER